jgi:hypothetical protein
MDTARLHCHVMTYSIIRHVTYLILVNMHRYIGMVWYILSADLYNLPSKMYAYEANSDAVRMHAIVS